MRLSRGIPVLVAMLVVSVPSSFAIDGPNLVVNSGFNTDLSNWRAVVASAAPANGTARLTLSPPNANFAGDMRQCISIPGLTAGRKFRWGGKVFIPPGQAVGGNAYMFLVWVRTVSSFGDCDGHAQVDFGGGTNVVGQWVNIDAPVVTVPAGAIGAQISFNLQPSATLPSGSFSTQVDDAYLIETGITPALTIDGPQSGLAFDSLSFEASATNCTPALNGWTWTATGGATLSGAATRTVSVQWPSAGTFTVSVSNRACTPASASKAVAITVPPPDLVATSVPRGIVQVANTGGGTDGVTLRNSGGQTTRVTLSVDASVATLSPSQFDLASGEQRAVSITGVARPAGAYSATIVAAGSGVARSLSIPLRLLSVAPPAAPVVSAPLDRRVDVAAGPGQNPSGTVQFTNSGTGTLTGVLVPSVPWIKPQEGIISIPPGGTVTATFTTDRAQRYDAEQTLGSSSGEISLVYPTGGSSSGRVAVNATPPVSVSTVTVVDTVRPAVTTGAIPPLSGAVALFLAGAGRVQGSVGLFTTDVAFTAGRGQRAIDPVRMFYTSVAGGPAAIIDLPALPANASASFADFVKQLFRRDGEVGTVQIRTTSPNVVAATASVFNVSNPAGTYGTALPLIRSDVAIGAGEVAALTGVRSDGGAHTNLFVQETSGTDASVQVEFFDAAGVSKGLRTDSVSAFGLLQVNRVVPEGAVSALVTNRTGSGGRIVAFATPVDRISGDTWTVADWRQLSRYTFDEPLLIPVAGAVRGANNTFFRTDVAIMNTGTAPASGTLHYHPRGLPPVQRSVTINPRSTAVLNDIVGSLFGLTTDSVGFIRVIPAAGSRLAVSSRTYTTTAGSAATFGTGVPAQAISATLQAGDLRRLAGIEDAALSTIVAARPATFRSNIGLMEVSGQPATVRVTLRFTYPSGKVSVSGVVSKDYSLDANQFLLTGLTRDILGAGRDDLGDLENLVVEISVTGGDGRVAYLISSVDNGTGDTILRVE